MQCLDFDTLLRRESVRRVDLLQIDVEGFDFRRFQPRIVIYEHAGLSATDEKGSCRLLEDQGYRVRTVKGDTIGIRE